MSELANMTTDSITTLMDAYAKRGYVTEATLCGALLEAMERIQKLEDGLYFYANPTAWPKAVMRDRGEIAKKTLGSDA